jgi:ZIP family zinc transporter
MLSHPGQFLSLFLLAGIPVATALLGGLIGALGTGGRRLPTGLIINFAAGAFLAVALFHLLPEAASRTGWPITLAAGGAGWVLSLLLAKWAGGFCPACQDPHVATANDRVAVEHATSLVFGLPLLIVIGFHSSLDGLALVGGAQGSEAADLLTLAVLIHKLPEGMAVAAICRSEGKSPAASLGITALIEAATFVGLAFGVLVGHGGGLLLGVTLGMVAGSFIYLVALTFLAPATRHAAQVVSAAAGALLILGARLLFHGLHL